MDANINKQTQSNLDVFFIKKPTPILSKLACGLHKPNQQTLLPPSSVSHLFETIPIKKIKNLGGKLGDKVKQEFNCKFMSDLAAIPLNDLQQKFNDKTCNFLYQISKGIDNEPVESRLIPKSIGSCKSFPIGLKIKEEVQLWLNTLMNDIVDKLKADYESNRRKATLMTVSVRYLDKKTKLPTSQCSEVTTYNYNKLLNTAYSSLCSMTENQKSLHWKNSISFLGVAIGKFVGTNAKSSIDNYFNKGAAKEDKDLNNQSTRPENSTTCSKINSESDSSTLCSEQQLNSKKSALLSNKLLPSLNHKDKKIETCISDVRNLKTMFDQMKNASSSLTDSSSTSQNINSKKEIIKQNKLDMNSFFTKKLEIISPVKNQENEKLTTVDECSASSGGFLLESTKVLSPLKNILNDTYKKTNQSTDSFFSKKLEIVSPSKLQKNNDTESVPILQMPITEETNECAPTTLICERCNKMIDIDIYDEHIDHHVAIELSESFNITEPVQPLNNRTFKSESTKKKKSECGQKRKNSSKASNLNTKKPCTSISSYFTPLLKP